MIPNRKSRDDASRNKNKKKKQDICLDPYFNTCVRILYVYTIYCMSILYKMLSMT